MIRLAHDKDFLPECLGDFFALDQPNVEALDGKVNPGLSVAAFSNNPCGPGPEDRAVVDPVVDALDLPLGRGLIYIYIGRLVCIEFLYTKKKRMR